MLIEKPMFQLAIQDQVIPLEYDLRKINKKKKKKTQRKVLYIDEMRIKETKS